MNTPQAVMYYNEPVTKREFWATLDEGEKVFFKELNEEFKTGFMEACANGNA